VADSLTSVLASGPFGLGCAPLGNLYRAMSDDEAEALLDHAWAAGVRWFDTAPHYGLGLSERRLGQFLSRKPRDEYVVSTKVGRRLEPTGTSAMRDDEGFDVPATHRRVWDFSAAGVQLSLEQSMERLGIEHIDFVLLHDPSDHLERAAFEAAPSLHGMRRAGVVGAIGAGTRDLDALTFLIEAADLDLVMTAGRYTLLDQTAGERLLPLCIDKGIPAVNVGVFNSGILATDRPSETARFEYVSADQPLLDRARAIAALSERHGSTLPAAALAFATSHEAIAAIAVGAASASEVVADSALTMNPPPVSFWRELADTGLVDARALGPLIADEHP
jgi:D-threo-aldose 1-dehydrogenase